MEGEAKGIAHGAAQRDSEIAMSMLTDVSPCLSDVYAHMWTRSMEDYTLQVLAVRPVVEVVIEQSKSSRIIVVKNREPYTAIS